MKKNTALIAVIVSVTICVLVILATVLYILFSPSGQAGNTFVFSIGKINLTPSDGSNTVSSKNDTGFDKADLAEKADRIFDEQYADFSVLVANPKTGDYLFAKDSGNKMVSASVIKIFIMLHAYSEIQAGNADNTEYIESLVYPMITVSDNDATNKLIDYYSPEAINATISKYGFTSTALNRKMLDTAAQDAGIENYTSCSDCCNFLSRMYNRTLLGEEYDKKMQSILKRQQVATKIRAKLPNVSIANKTGELAAVENDVGIVYASESGGNDFILCVLSNNVKQNASAREAISEYANYLYNISVPH